MIEVDNNRRQGRFDTNGGNNTQDKGFLLSYVEARKYFINDDARVCQPTAYVLKQDANQESNGNCWWWLRSPGSSSSSACFVDHCGVHYYINVNSGFIAVRPALRLDLTSDIF